MQRLTKWDDTGAMVLCNCEEMISCPWDCNKCSWEEQVKNRLAAYEDTGLTPEEIETMKDSIGAAYKIIAEQETQDDQPAQQVKTYKITINQKCMGEEMTNSYNRQVSSYDKLMKVVDTLYEDPCVVKVEWEEVTDQEQEGEKA